eukprot:1147974-Pelagomonas_calceolata.AAC.4
MPAGMTFPVYAHGPCLPGKGLRLSFLGSNVQVDVFVKHHPKVSEGFRKKTKNYVDRGSSPYINYRKEDTLAKKSLESPPPRSYKKKILLGIWRVIGSTRLHNLAAR